MSVRTAVAICAADGPPPVLPETEVSLAPAELATTKSAALASVQTAAATCDAVGAAAYVADASRLDTLASSRSKIEPAVGLEGMTAPSAAVASAWTFACSAAERV